MNTSSISMCAFVWAAQCRGTLLVPYWFDMIFFFFFFFCFVPCTQKIELIKLTSDVASKSIMKCKCAHANCGVQSEWGQCQCCMHRRVSCSLLVCWFVFLVFLPSFDFKRWYVSKNGMPDMCCLIWKFTHHLFEFELARSTRDLSSCLAVSQNHPDFD